LSRGNQLAHIAGRGVSEVEHDVGVDVGDLGVTDPEPFQPTLIDQTARPDPFDLLEDGAGTRVKLEPGMSGSAPGKILLKDALHCISVAGLQPEGDGKGNVIAMMKDAVIVTELHIIAVD
jgi:hypothetical protein